MRLFVMTFLLSTALSAAVPDKIDFNKHVRPLLSDRCFKCHGPDGGEFGEDWEGGLRLDTEKGAKADLSAVKLKVKNAKRKTEGKPPSDKKSKARYAIVPGKIHESSLVERIFTDDADDLMPPPDSNLKLSKDEKDILKAWIEQGAKWGKHWSYVAPVKSKLPKVQNESWPRNEIDYYVLKKLEEKGLKPSDEADRISWIRRVYLDLTGLPPTPQEADAFLADKGKDAYEKVVDRILKSDAYAERMTLEWLDNARYADTSGYQYDKPRSMWPWRDWVLQAFKQNKTYGEFVTEQIAGDLLPNATMQQRIATGFNRNHGFTIEGGVIGEEYRIQYVNDRVITFGTLFLGMTMDCTRCHSHKYDPLTAKDFYSLSAFFDKMNESGKGSGLAVKPFVNYPLFNEGEVKKLEQTLAALRNKKLSAAEEASFAQWKETGHKAEPFGRVISVKSKGGATVTDAGDLSYRFTGINPARDSYTFNLEIDSKDIRSVVVEALPDSSMVNNGPGRATNGNAVMSGIEVLVNKGRRPVTLSTALADHSQKGYPVSGLLKRKSSGWGIDGNTKHDKRTAVFELKNPVQAKGKVQLTVKLHFNTGFDKHQFGRVRVRASNLTAGMLFSSLKGGPAGKSEKALKEYFTRYILGGGTLGKKMSDIESKINAAKKTVPVMVMQDNMLNRQTHVLDRGEYDKKAAKVSPAVPEVLPGFTKDMPDNRLGLAKWLLMKENPLFSRVTVNRYWQMLFGVGIVKTTEDFGAQGEEPTHPELLDWLAVDFRENNWDLHKLLKKIVLSAAYRQSSKIRKDISDPENRLLAHGPRFRLAGEVIRDQALKIAGLLSSKTGGPSVYPYQPAGLWIELTNRPGYQMVYKESTGEELYRKSLYTFWKRAMPNPSLTTFDAPERDVCVVKRARTNTPLQALILLHDPTYVEASRALADKVLRNPASKNIDAAVVNAFRNVLIRRPSQEEVQILTALYNQKKTLLQKKPDLIERQLSVGAFQHQPGLDKLRLAAFTSVCQALLNLSETITRN